MSKTHYRKVFKSNHLSTADLEDFIESGKSLVYTIKEVKQEIDVDVAGKKMSGNIAYFNEPIKPLVLNATNCKLLANLVGSSFVEDWHNIKVELYILSNIKFGREYVDGVRIKAPSQTVAKLDDVQLAAKVNQCANLAELTVLYNQNKPISTEVQKVFEAKKRSWVINNTKP